MKDLVGRRVRCLSSGKVYLTVAQSGDDIVVRDETTGEHTGLSASQVTRHSPGLIALGAVIQTVVFADYAPLGHSAHLVRGGFVGSLLAFLAAWGLGLSAGLLLLSYVIGGTAGVLASAALRFRQRIMDMKTTRARNAQWERMSGSGSPSSVPPSRSRPGNSERGDG